MARILSVGEVSDRIRAVEVAQTSNFVELTKIAGLNPSHSFKFMNLSGVDFSGCNLNGFNFVGANLRNAKFFGAQIKGSIFDFHQISLPGLKQALDFRVLMVSQPYQWPGDINALDEHGFSPIANASIDGDVEIARWLLKHPNINPNVVDIKGRTPLFLAVQFNRARVVRLLLGNTEVDPSQQCGRYGSPLTRACYNCNYVVARILLSRVKYERNKESGAKLAERAAWGANHRSMELPHGTSNMKIIVSLIRTFKAIREARGTIITLHYAEHSGKLKAIICSLKKNVEIEIENYRFKISAFAGAIISEGRG